MSERKAKINRKNVQSEGKNQVKKDKATVIFTVIAVLLVVAILALGIYAVIPEFKSGGSETETPKTVTVGDVIAEEGITLDEFKAEYGIVDAEDVTEESDINTAITKFNLVNYAKYTEVSLEELRETYKLGADVPDETVWSDAILKMSTEVIAREFFGTDFETLKTQIGLDESITAETTWQEVNDIMTAKQAEAEQTEGEE